MLPNRQFYVAQALLPTPAFDTAGTSAHRELVCRFRSSLTYRATAPLRSRLRSEPRPSGRGSLQIRDRICEAVYLVAELVGRTPWSGCPLGRDALVPPAQWRQHLVGWQQADEEIGRASCRERGENPVV